MISDKCAPTGMNWFKLVCLSLISDFNKIHPFQGLYPTRTTRRIQTLGGLYFLLHHAKNVCNEKKLSSLSPPAAGMLWCGSFLQWITYLTEGEVYPWAWTDCKLTYFLFYFCRHSSSALLVVMSLEKCFVLYFPLKAKTIFTVKTAKWVSGFVLLSFCIYDSQLFIIIESFLFYGLRYCTQVRISPNYWATYRIIDSILYSFGPFAIMLFATLAIICKFMQAKWSTRKMSHPSEVTSQALSKSASRGTAMLVTVSMTFIVLTSPVALNSAKIITTDSDIQTAVIGSMQYLNHGINVILYCVVGQKFRQELLKTLFFCQKSGIEQGCISGSILATDFSRQD